MPDSVNPYIAGSPITGSEMFFGREDVFDFVKRTLSGKHRDNVIVLYGQRRTGKTSVLYHISQHLDPNYLCVFVDLHALALNGVTGFLWELANYIVRGLRRDHGIDVPTPNRSVFMVDARDSFRNEFLVAVREAIGNRHLLLMLDEVGRLHEKIQAGELESNVFEYLRHLMQHYDWFDFLYSLGSSLEEMQQEYSLLFSVALYKQISFLTKEAATQLITIPIQNQYKIQPAAVSRILEITSGHPYYTQLICHCLFSRWQQAPQDAMTVRDVEEILDLAIELGSANLKFAWEQSDPGEKAVMAGLAASVPGRMQISDLNSVWMPLDVVLPDSEIAKAIRSLAARDLIACNDQFRFTVDLQRLWIRQQRRLDWVKEEVSNTLPKWRATKETEWKHIYKLWTPAFVKKFGLGLAVAILLSVALALSWHRIYKRSVAKTELLNSESGASSSPTDNSSAENSGDRTFGPRTQYTVSDLVRLYNFPTEFEGRGQSIGLIEFGGGYRNSDLKAYFSGLGIPEPKVTAVSVDGVHNQPGPGGNIEAGLDAKVTMDIEIVGAAAPEAELVVYFAPLTEKGWVDVLGSAVNDNVHKPSILVIGWGSAEGSFSSQAIHAIDDVLQAAKAKGITVCVASGDQGAADGVSDGLTHVDFPASSPWVLAVGGTTLIALGNTIGIEKVWNDGDYATGGGMSRIFPAPDWQAHVKLPSIPATPPGRGVPDVAAHADPLAGYRTRIHGRDQIQGGTGASAALWAGLIARINQGLGRNVGYLNPLLYGTIGPAGILRSVTKGNNGSRSGVAKVDGFSGGPGWNPCTGWGTPDGRKLLSALRAQFGIPEPARKQDYSPLMLPVRNSGAEGSVAGFAVAAALEYQIRAKWNEEIRISPRFIYYYARLIDGTEGIDSGARLEAAIEVISKRGAIPESAWPYVAGEFAKKPPDLRNAVVYRAKYIHRINSLSDVIAELQQTGPIVTGVTLFQSAWSLSTRTSGVLPMPSDSEQVVGGHAICIVGYDDDKRLLKFINDWGPDWGDHGYGYLPFDYFQKYSADSWAIIM